MKKNTASLLKQNIFALLKLTVSIGLLALLLRSLDLAAVAAVLGRLPTTAIAAGLILILAQVAVLGLRWWLVMAAIEAPIELGKALPITFIGVFFNQVLPTSFGGDAVRMWQAHRLGVSGQAAVIGVFLERIGGLFGLVVLTALGAAYLGGDIDNLAIRLGLLATLPLGIAGVLALAALDRLPERWRRVPPLREAARLARNSRRVFLAPMGVREGVLMALLAPAVGTGPALVLSIGSRLLLTATEVVAALVGLMMKTHAGEGA